MRRMRLMKSTAQSKAVQSFYVTAFFSLLMVVFDFEIKPICNLRMTRIQGHVFITQNARASKQIEVRMLICIRRATLRRFTEKKATLVRVSPSPSRRAQLVLILVPIEDTGPDQFN